MKEITHQEFVAQLKAQGVPRRHVAFICPMCKTPQSMDCLINAGAGKTEDDVEKYIGFSCVGRWTKAGGPRKQPDGKPCNWTLGGLLSLHDLVVIHEGKKHPHFEVATLEQAQALLASKGGQP